jgi:hypothetical protein
MTRRFVGVVSEGRTYRNLAYLLLGLPLGTAWFTVLVTGLAVGGSLVVVALVGVPVLLLVWWSSRLFANVERFVARRLLGSDLRAAPWDLGGPGGVWSRLRRMTADRARWRELGYLLLRFPAGIATFTIAAAVLTASASIAYAPVHVRIDDREPFGSWRYSQRLESVAGHGPWCWLLIPAGVLALVVCLHGLNALARACGRWSTASLGTPRRSR